MCSLLHTMKKYILHIVQACRSWGCRGCHGKLTLSQPRVADYASTLIFAPRISRPSYGPESLRNASVHRNNISIYLLFFVFTVCVRQLSQKNDCENQIIEIQVKYLSHTFSTIYIGVKSFKK